MKVKNCISVSKETVAAKNNFLSYLPLEKKKNTDISSERSFLKFFFKTLFFNE